MELGCSAISYCDTHPPTVTWTPALGLSTQLQQNNTVTSTLTFNASHLHHGNNVSCTAAYFIPSGNKTVMSRYQLSVSCQSMYYLFNEMYILLLFIIIIIVIIVYFFILMFSVNMPQRFLDLRRQSSGLINNDACPVFHIHSLYFIFVFGTVVLNSQHLTNITQELRARL